MTNYKPLFGLNIAMIMVSTSGALGRYIQMAPPLIILYRCAIAAVCIGAYCLIMKWKFDIKKKDLPILIGSAVLLAIHWVTYFYSLHLSNVAIGMLSLFTYPVITALLEPVILRNKLKLIHVVLAIIALLGVYFLIPNAGFSDSYGLGLMLGLFSALCYALRNILMKTKVSQYQGSVLMFHQLIIVCLVLFPALFFMDSRPMVTQWPWVVTVAVVTTAIGHTWFLSSFKHFSVTTISILSSVQPIYGIVFGIILLGEVPGWNIYIGGFLILSTVFIEAFRTSRG